MNVLCVDRSPLGLMDLKRKTHAACPGAVIHAVRDPERALVLAEKEGCDVLLTEIDLGRKRREGLDFARRMQEINPKVNIIFITGYSEAEYARDIIQMRASGFVQKPFPKQRLAEEFSHLRYDAQEVQKR